jgi:hypothetical protein
MRTGWPLSRARRTAAVALWRLRKTRRRYLPAGVVTSTTKALQAASMSAAGGRLASVGSVGAVFLAGGGLFGRLGASCRVTTCKLSFGFFGFDG